MQAEGATYTDLRKLQIKVKMLNVGLGEEWCILNGDSSVDPLQFDGLSVQVTNAFDYSTFTPDNATFKLLESVTKTSQYIANNGGQPRLVVCSYNMRSKLINQIQANFYGIRQMGKGNLGPMSGGVNIESWDFGWGECEIIASRYLSANAYGKETIYVLDHQSLDTFNNGNVCQMVDLSPIGAVDLAMTYTAWRTIVYESSVFMISVPNFQYKIINIT